MRLDWFSALQIIHLVLLSPSGLKAFRKGHWILGLAGIAFPVLWLIGSVLPRRRTR